jgi:hypothetical protein
MGYHASGSGKTLFADTLKGADRPFYIGNDWLCVHGASDVSTGVTLAAQINIGATGLTFGSGSGNNDNGMRVLIYPGPVDETKVRARSISIGLFVECIFVALVAAGVDCEAGLAIMINPGDEKGYYLDMQSESGNVLLRRTEGAQTVLSTPTTKAALDLFRLECRIIGTTNELRTYKNNVLVNTFSDVAPTVQAGLYGMAFMGVFSGQVTVSNFRGGLISQV